MIKQFIFQNVKIAGNENPYILTFNTDVSRAITITTENPVDVDTTFKIKYKNFRYWPYDMYKELTITAGNNTISSTASGEIYNIEANTSNISDDTVIITTSQTSIYQYNHRTVNKSNAKRGVIFYAYLDKNSGYGSNKAALFLVAPILMYYPATVVLPEEPDSALTQIPLPFTSELRLLISYYNGNHERVQKTIQWTMQPNTSDAHIIQIIDSDFYYANSIDQLQIRLENYQFEVDTDNEINGLFINSSYLSARSNLLRLENITPSSFDHNGGSGTAILRAYAPWQYVNNGTLSDIKLNNETIETTSYQSPCLGTITYTAPENTTYEDQTKDTGDFKISVSNVDDDYSQSVSVTIYKDPNMVKPWELSINNGANVITRLTDILSWDGPDNRIAAISIIANNGQSVGALIDTQVTSEQIPPDFSAAFTNPTKYNLSVPGNCRLSNFISSLGTQTGWIIFIWAYSKDPDVNYFSRASSKIMRVTPA